MSWQRILELARRQGVPLIITDVAGREPMVILPLSEYERLSDEHAESFAVPFAEGGFMQNAQPNRTYETNRTDKTYSAQPEAPKQPIFTPEIAEIPKITVPEAPKMSVMQEMAAPVAPQAPGISLEERFYLDAMSEHEPLA